MRTLDDIVPPSRRSAVSPDAPLTLERRRGQFPLGTLVVVLFIIAVSAGALFYFSNALVKITPQTYTATLTDTPFTSSFDAGELPFQVITVQKVASQSVTSSGTKSVSASAQGTITITNSQNTVQKLITNTRFQTATGLVFRIHAPVNVPAAKGPTPGSITAVAYADKPGSEYNVGPTDFTLPGLSGTAQFTKVVAKSSAPMSGGASGNEPSVTPAIESATRTALMDSLAKDLSETIVAQVPEGYILLKGATVVSYAQMPTTLATDSSNVDVKEQGTMRGITLPSTALAKAIAVSVLSTAYKGEAVTLGSTANLVLKPTSTLPNSGDPNFSFTLSGTVPLISKVQSTRISAAIAGKTRSDAQAILKQYPEVEQALLILRPFWRGTFPSDPSQIHVELVPSVGGN